MPKREVPGKTGPRVLAHMLGIENSELAAWDHRGLLMPERDANNHRVYSDEEVALAQHIARYRMEYDMSLEETYNLLQTKEGHAGITDKRRCKQVLCEYNRGEAELWNRIEISLK